MMPHVGSVPHCSGANAERVPVCDQQYCRVAVLLFQPAEQAEKPGRYLLDAFTCACTTEKVSLLNAPLG